MGQFTDWLTNFGFGQVGQLAGNIWGQITGQQNDKRQLAQNQALLQQQVGAQEQMGAYNENLQLDLWNKTGPQQQMQRYKDAGLNPALMYGGGGVGGQTISNLNTQGVNGGTAQQNPGEQTTAQGMGIQLANAALQNSLLKSQRENIDADTANKQADTANKPLQGKNIEANTENLLQTYDNLRQTHEYIIAQTSMQRLQNSVYQATANYQINHIQADAQQAVTNVKLLANQAKVSDETLTSQIQQIKQTAIGAMLQNSLTQAQTETTKSQALVNRAQLDQIAADISTKWGYLNNDNLRVILQQQLTDWDTNTINKAVDQLLSPLKNLFVHIK